MQVGVESRRMQPQCKNRYEPISTPNPIAAMRKLSTTRQPVVLTTEAYTGGVEVS